MASLVTVEDFEKRIAGGIPSSDEPRAQAALDDASALIRAESGGLWQTGTVPDVIKAVCVAAAKRVFVNPDGVTAESVGTSRTTFSSGEVHLTPDERQVVRRAAKKTGVWTQPTTRAISDIGDLPAVASDVSVGSGIPAESDPFGEGWGK